MSWRPRHPLYSRSDWRNTRPSTWVSARRHACPSHILGHCWIRLDRERSAEEGESGGDEGRVGKGK